MDYNLSMLLVFGSASVAILSGLVMVVSVVIRCVICVRKWKNRQLLVRSDAVELSESSEQREPSDPSSDILELTLSMDDT